MISRASGKRFCKSSYVRSPSSQDPTLGRRAPQISGAWEGLIAKLNWGVLPHRYRTARSLSRALELRVVEIVEGAAAAHELGEAAVVDDGAIAQHQDHVGVAHG